MKECLKTKIIAVTGYSGSGKSEFAKVLRDESGAEMLNVGDIMREIAKKQDFDKLSDFMEANGIEYSFSVSRQLIINRIVQNYPERNVVLDGVYDPGLVEKIVKVSGAGNAVVVSVYADIEVRRRRVAGRNGSNHNMSIVETERRDRIKNLAGIGKVMNMASFTVSNNGSLWELKDAIHTLSLSVFNGK